MPFRYSSADDTLFYLSLVKGMIHNGWFFTNHGLGAPIGQQLFDFPQSADNLNLLLAKGLTALPRATRRSCSTSFTCSPIRSTRLAAFWVLRRLGASRGVAVVCAVLFALLPYHLWRDDSHLFLSAYYSLPLTAYLFIVVLSGRPLFSRRADAAGGRFRVPEPQHCRDGRVCASSSPPAACTTPCSA